MVVATPMAVVVVVVVGERKGCGGVEREHGNGDEGGPRKH